MSSFLRYLLPLSLMASACAAEPAEVDASSEAVSHAEMNVKAMPAMVSLCPGSASLSLPNAAWSAWFSANAYVHLATLAPEIEKASFGKPGDGAAWRSDWTALKAALDRNDPASAQIEKELIQTVHLERGLDFFSGGRIVVRQGRPSFEKGSTQVTWAQHRTQPSTIIAFRGTENDENADLLADLNALMVPSVVGGHVHSGFTQGEAEVESFLLERVRALPPKSSVVITGHSLGAAVGTLFLAKLMTLGLDHHYEMYTFGSPRVGNQEFVTQFDARAAALGIPVGRFENGTDPIVVQPFEMFGFRHVGVPIILGKAGLVVNGVGAMSRFGSLTDHLSKNYWDRITNAAVLQRPTYEIDGVAPFERITLGDLVRCTAR